MTPEVRVLIVDDNSATRYALRRRLEQHDITILEAGTGGDGLALIASEPLDALILDVNLPDMSGFDIVRLLRAKPATALLPIIHVSAASIQTGDIITGLEAGADAYLIHPVDADVLLATLRTLLRVRDTENALRESEARFREIFANIAAPIAVIDEQLQVIECNHAFSQLLPTPVSLTSLQTQLAAGQESVLDDLQVRLSKGERWRGNLTLKVDEQLRETEWQVSPYRAPGHSLVFIEDVTEHRQRERQQQIQLADAQTLLAQEVAERARTETQLLQVQKMDALGKLTGGIAHDFNNLLTGIITALELIKKRVEPAGATASVDKTVSRYADAALQSATNAAALTHRMLAFARQQPLDTRPIAINQHVHSLEDLLRRTIGERITLSLDLTDSAAIAMVDPIQFENAVLNLVINARDALPEGGNIRLSTFAAYSRGDTRLADGDYVVLSVRDDGTGIDHSIIDKVFDPFFTTKAVGKGTGLGLSTIYGFARQSGGDVRIRSLLGHGTEVTLMLPAGLALLPLPSEPVQLENRGKGEHLLIVEDMASVRMFVVEALTDAGYRCTEVDSALDALQALRTDPSIQLLLTDVGLPQMNGRVLADAARDMRPELPVLFMTGYAENALDLQTFLAEGMDLVIKPFRMGDLVSRIAHLLDRDPL
ncbi:response regulator [Pseudomonas coleopterorum]|uniref:histidine kinase n=1 Tax=Pseudomonas coleopterorum TaxID=1605838 RepID=A0ABR9BZY9_9PSED|nr:response regulator [Pseudomonas coleopterorum]MBD8753899.1 response regulator [Pseudomonas coleopterorum]MBD8770008.1 response regulator [Pseudomonas coleopterorum]